MGFDGQKRWGACWFAVLCLLGGLGAAEGQTAGALQPAQGMPLLVVGFMGGRVRADNLLHKEAVIAQELQQRDGSRVKVLTFANHAGSLPLASVVQFLDVDGDGRLSAAEKAAARIVIYGHSWGASETVHLADELDALGIPVLLTIQVDSVQKFGENDAVIPANVREAMNFYQTQGMLHGRARIRAGDPSRTVILGNQLLDYRKARVDCGQFPWFARTFMEPHIEIENDPKVWGRVESMIQARVDPPLPSAPFR